MAQADYSISNQGFPATRADINSHLEAIATNNSGTSAPSTQYAGQFWIDTTSSTWTLYIHDGADDIQFATIDTSANTVNFIDSALDVVTDTTPQLGGDLDTNGNNIDFGDNVKARFGTGNDLEIYHDGSNSYVKDAGTGNLRLEGTDIRIANSGGTADYLRATNGGSVDLLHNNSVKFSTTSNGVTITGGTEDTLRITNDDDGLGTAPDIVMYRNSSSPADNDNLGLIEWTGNQSNGGEHTYAYIRAKATDVTAGTEDAKIDFAVSIAGTAGIIASVTNAGFVPETNDTFDLGSSSLVWRNIYTGDLHLSNEAKSEGNSVDNTKGNWTIQEGAEDLFILNNKTGKKFKFKLEEII